MKYKSVMVKITPLSNLPGKLRYVDSDDIKLLKQWIKTLNLKAEVIRRGKM